MTVLPVNKKFLLINLLLLGCVPFTFAGINKVYLVTGDNPFTETPIHGKIPFREWLKNDKLAFAKGHSYRMWIDYSTQLPATGTIASTSKSVQITDCRRKLNGYEFTLTVDASAKRGSVFTIGFRDRSSRLSDAIVCQVVQIGRLDAMVIQDTTNTTFAGLYSKTTYWTFHYTHGTGPRVWSFYGKGLENARFDYSADFGQAKGLQFYADLAVQTDTSFDIVFTVSDEVTGEKGSLRKDVLARLYDAVADRRYEWITYEYAIPSELEKSPDAEGVLGDPAFELTPGHRRELCSTCKGYHRFLDTLYKVD
ncbi:MAG: hypothetical protein RL213_2172 [Bacteroidota bacterium]|jgi:hypothetical protein